MADETFAVFGAGLLAVHSAGLGIPFLLAAISIWLLDTAAEFRLDQRNNNTGRNETPAKDQASYRRDLRRAALLLRI